MGVRFLKSIIENHCKNAYTTLSLFSLSHQTVIIDTNIYMYKFKSSHSLVKGFENMLDKFVLYNIRPIFVFDGIPQCDKQTTIDIRKKKRETSCKLLNNIKQEISHTTHKNHLRSLNKKLEYHQISSTKLYSSDFITVKNIIDSYGFDIVQAKYEADEVCARFNIDYNTFAVITEDTDLLVYGSKFVILNIDFDTEIFDVIHTDTLLKTLNIKSLLDFQQICILSGTDYNKAFNIHFALCMYNFYIQTKPPFSSFLRWSYTNNIISKKQYYSFKTILDKYIGEREPRFSI
tara:strand:- start:460 stop:1329 length:870 start_codon:yes stop_codon:yes gene_type:complete